MDIFVLSLNSALPTFIYRLYVRAVNRQIIYGKYIVNFICNNRHIYPNKLTYEAGNDTDQLFSVSPYIRHNLRVVDYILPQTFIVYYLR